MKKVTKVRDAVLKLALALQTVRYRLLNSRIPPRYVLADVPYFAQWESRGLVSKILSGAVKAQDDPNWRASGARSRAEYALWSWAGCGMACLKMILMHRDGRVLPLVVLGKRCAEYGGYDMPLETSIGLKYKPFAQFVQHEFGMSARASSILSREEIAHELASGTYVMASVNAMIRDTRSKPASRGGHVVLVVGYDLAKKEFYLHNPSGGSAATEAYAAVSFRNFQRFFSNRGVVISG